MSNDTELSGDVAELEAQLEEKSELIEIRTSRTSKRGPLPAIR